MLLSKSEMWCVSSVCVVIVIYQVVWNTLTWFVEMKPAFRLNTFCSDFFLLFSLEGFCERYLAEKIGSMLE